MEGTKCMNKSEEKRYKDGDNEEDGLDHKRAILEPYKQPRLFNSTEMSAGTLPASLCVKI